MNEKELKAIEERAEKATPRPWTTKIDSLSGRRRRCIWSSLDPDGQTASTDQGWVVAEGRMEEWSPPRGVKQERTLENGPADAEFIAHARQDVPTLVDEVRMLRRTFMELFASLTLCDHMGDVTNEMDALLKRLEVELPDTVDDAPDFMSALGAWLGQQGVTTLNGTLLGQE